MTGQHLEIFQMGLDLKLSTFSGLRKFLMGLDLENFHDRSELRNFSNDFELRHFSSQKFETFQLSLDLDLF